jgi:transcriptional regulator with XRE-family HTH domain
MYLERLVVDNIKRIRKNKGISQEKLAEACNTATSYIGLMEIHKNVPKLSTIERIAEALEIDPLVLFQDASKISSKQGVELQKRKKKVLSLIERELDDIVLSKIFDTPETAGRSAAARGGSCNNDSIRAVDAKFEAQKIAFAPLAFQAVRSLRDLGLLRAVSDAGDRGISREEAARAADISLYGAGVLLEMALGLGVVKTAGENPGEGGGASERAGALEDPRNRTERFVLGKIGWFLLEDGMTAVNFDFVNDICYRGAFELSRSIRDGVPRGLETFGPWPTIYEALSSLPEREKKSWFDFDHFYSDLAFPAALPLVFDRKPRTILDIGGNTAKWAIQCCRHDPEVKVIVADLPGQTAEAEKNAAAAGFGDRISVYPCNVLDPASALPAGADAVWMSQFLDCFALEDVTAILKKVAAAAGKRTEVYVLEPLWDRQRFEAAAFSLQALSLYFTCMANGRSKIYRYEELCRAVEAGGFSLADERHDLGSNCYSLLRFRLKG